MSWATGSILGDQYWYVFTYAGLMLAIGACINWLSSMKAWSANFVWAVYLSAMLVDVYILSLRGTTYSWPLFAGTFICMLHQLSFRLDIEDDRLVDEDLPPP